MQTSRTSMNHAWERKRSMERRRTQRCRKGDSRAGSKVKREVHRTKDIPSQHPDKGQGCSRGIQAAWHSSPWSIHRAKQLAKCFGRKEVRLKNRFLRNTSYFCAEIHALVSLPSCFLLRSPERETSRIEAWRSKSLCLRSHF